MNRGDILDKAKEIICHDRNNQYGEPEDSFDVVASYWTIYLKSNYPEMIPNLTREDAANMMVLFKMARNNMGKSKLDNFIDIVGYAAIAGEMHEKNAWKHES